MKHFIKISAVLFLFVNGWAQAQSRHFITNGTIEYEKTQNMFAILKKKVTPDNAGNKGFYEDYLKSEKQFLKYKSTLTFSANNSLFTPIPGQSLPWYYFAPMGSQLNTIFSDLANGTATVQKEIYERTYLVKDSLRKIKWKITDDTRVIAGYNCRRANGIMLDSMYVVAFYAEDIHVSGGPESFNGLPGMILGVVLPHENVNWYATKVNPDPVDDKKLASPKKGTPVNNKQLYQLLLDSQSKWGQVGQYLIRGFYF